MNITTPLNSTNHNHRHHGSLFTLPGDPYAAVVYGFVSPVVVMATLATNGVVCAVLLQKSMRTPVNVVLLAMAVADTLTGACPMPCFLNFFTFAGRNKSGLVPYGWCYLYLCLTDFLPTIFHTASLWLTVALAVQRFTTVCRGAKMPAATSRRSMDAGGTKLAAKVVLFVYTAAGLSQITRFFDSQYFPVVLEEVSNLTSPSAQHLQRDNNNYNHNNHNYNYNNNNNNITTHTPFLPPDNYSISNFRDANETHSRRDLAPVGVTEELYCHIRRYDFFERYAWLYFNAYFWFRVIFIHLVPCIVLLVMNGMLICALRSASLRKRRLMQMDRRSGHRAPAAPDEQSKEARSCSVSQLQESQLTRRMTTEMETMDGNSQVQEKMKRDSVVVHRNGQGQQLRQRRNHRSSLKIFRRRLRQKSPTIAVSEVDTTNGKESSLPLYLETKQLQPVNPKFYGVDGKINPENCQTFDCRQEDTTDFEATPGGGCFKSWKKQSGSCSREKKTVSLVLTPIDASSRVTSLAVPHQSRASSRSCNAEVQPPDRPQIVREGASTAAEATTAATTAVARRKSSSTSKQLLSATTRSDDHSSHGKTKSRAARQGDNRRLTDIDNTTRMLVVVVGLVLLVELPQLCLIVIFVCMQNFYVVLIEDELLGRLTVTSNLCIMLSYPLNFFIYCAMSRKFKTSIYQLLDCRKGCPG